MNGTRQVHRHGFGVMGTHASLVARTDARSFRRLVRVCETTLAAAERRFTPFDSDSELWQLRRGETEPSDDMRRVLDGCRLLETVTDGAFQARDPRGRTDTTGFVKGWAMQQVKQRADDLGLDDWLLNVGGDIVASGRNGERPWRVALRHPQDAGRVAEVIELRGGAVATSGDYERGAHVWDRHRRLGRRAGSVTVVGPRIDIADGLATACWAHGAAEPAWLARLPEYLVLSISDDGVVTSAGFPLHGRSVPSGA